MSVKIRALPNLCTNVTAPHCPFRMPHFTGSSAKRLKHDAREEGEDLSHQEESDAIRSCAEVAFVPGERSEKKDGQPLRYIAIRIGKKQGHLYDDGSRVRHFAVVTNIEEWFATKLIQWHREKAGTVGNWFMMC